MELSQRLDLSALTANTEEPEADQSVMAQLAGLIADISGVSAESVTPEKTLAEAGVSSLDRIELAVRAEETFGTIVEETLISETSTVGEIADYFSSAT